MGDDDGWDDDAPKAPEYISVARVIRDYIPASNTELTLILGRSPFCDLSIYPFLFPF